MKSLRLVLLLFFIFLITNSLFAKIPSVNSLIGELEQPENLMMAKVKFKNFKKEMPRLNQLHLDLAGIDIKNNSADLFVTESEIQKLESLGFNVTVIMTQTLLRAPDSQYKTSAEIEKILRDYNQSYPDLTELKVIGKSLEDRPIWAMKITKQANLNQAISNKPVFLFNGMHHAREVMSPEVILDIIETLLTNYDKDDKIKHWVDSNEIWVLPMLNVDGNNLVWTENNMWRKNARGGYGVDINRNYPYAWGSCDGSSGSRSAQDYRGESAGSEPETQVMMNFVKEIRPVFDISYHSYSELVIYPFGCEGKHTANSDVVETIGKYMGSQLGYTAGTSWETLYSVDGGDIDWMYSEYQVIPYVIEVNSSWEGFQPSYSKRNPTVALNRKAWQYLLDRIDGAGIRGKITSQSRNVSDFSVEVQIQKNSQFVPYMKYKGNSNGTYHLVLNPGTYRLQFAGPSIKSTVKDVVVGQSRVQLNLNL